MQHLITKALSGSNESNESGESGNDAATARVPGVKLFGHDQMRDRWVFSAARRTRARALDVIRQLSWAQAEMCGASLPDKSSLDSVLLSMRNVFANIKDEVVVESTLHGLSLLCEGDKDTLKRVMQHQLAPVMSSFLLGSPELCKPALRCVGNVVCAETGIDYTQAVVNEGVVPVLLSLSHSNDKEIVKEACWTLSNIAAGTELQVEQVVSQLRLGNVLAIAMSDEDQAVRNEACWVVLNAASCGTDAQVVQLVQAGGVKTLAHLISHKSMGSMAREGLSRILHVVERVATLERLLAAIQGKATQELVVSPSALRALQQAGGDVFTHLMQHTAEVNDKMETLKARGGSSISAAAGETLDGKESPSDEQLWVELQCLFDGI